MTMKTGKMVTALFAALMLVYSIPTAAAAASIEFTDSLKSSLDKTTVGADAAQAEKINSQYDEFLKLQKQGQDWDTKTKALKTANEKTLTELNKQIKQIDAAKLDKLEADAAQARERYKPLFSQYSSLNKQIEAARLLKNKELSGMLLARKDALKIPVELARMDIKAKDTERKAAKDAASKKMKKIRGTLADIGPIKVQIKAKLSAIRTIQTGVSPVWSAFKQAVKKRDAKSVQSAFTSLVSLSRQINEEKQKIFNLETKIGDILSAAKAQMP